MTRKEQLAKQVTKLRDAAKQLDPIAVAAVALIGLMVDDAKDSLVSAEGDDMLRLQGAARAMGKLHRDLTNTPPGIMETQA